MIRIFYDLETTGLNYWQHSIHQIGLLIEVNGLLVEQVEYKVQPNPKARVEAQALEVAGVSKEVIMAYEPMQQVFKKLITLLKKYINAFDKQQKAHLIGFNNRSFDDKFFRAWFVQNGSTYFGAYFWADSIDVLCLASQHLMSRRKDMKSFKLHEVATTLGIEVDESKLHDAVYDIELTRLIYQKITE